jgi:hypothetical protein
MEPQCLKSESASDEMADNNSTNHFTKKQVVMSNTYKCPFSAASTNTPIGGCPVMGPKHTNIKSLCDYLENILEFAPQKDKSNVITTASQLQDFIAESRNHTIPLDTDHELVENKANKIQELVDAPYKGADGKSMRLS